jgi:hypothetical protein
LFHYSKVFNKIPPALSKARGILFLPTFSSLP